MIVKKLRAVAMALVLGTAAVAAAGALMVTPAEAAVRASVGKPLQAAQAAAAAGNYSAAMARVHEAEGVGGLTAEEQKIINQMKDYIAAKSGGSVGVQSAIGAQAKFDADYRAGRYREAINDADLLRKYGAMSGANMVIIAQAYYRAGDYVGCARYARQAGNGSDLLDLQMRCAYEAHDDATLRSALETAVATTGKPEYWQRLLKFAEASKGLSDPQTLDIYRIRLLTGAMKPGPDDYFVLATLALQLGAPNEALSVVQKGMAAHLLVDSRAQRLYGLAKQSAAADIANLPRAVKAANASPRGDLLVTLGEDYCGIGGRYPDAIAAILAGIKKGVADPDDAWIRLGVAYYGAGQKDAALKAFAKADKTPNGQTIAHMWSLYVRGH